jgi:hypothetical protein
MDLTKRGGAKGWLAALAGLAALTGCAVEDPAIIGDWLGADIGGNRNLMVIDDDLSGRVRVYFYIDQDRYADDFVTECAACSDGWCCPMVCAGVCLASNWVMTCPDSEPSMLCSGSNDFAAFTFSWEKQ